MLPLLQTMLSRKMLEVRDQYLRQLPAVRPEADGPGADADAPLPESGIRQEELLQWYLDSEALK